MNRNLLTVGLVALLGVQGLALGETLESVEKALAEKMAARKTLKFKQKTRSDMKTPEMRLQVDADSVVTYARKPENGWASRIESKTRTVHTMKDQPETKQDGKMLTIADGKHMYILTETPEVTSAMKQKLDGLTALNPFDVKAQFAEQRKQFDLKLMPDEKIEGVECYAIESVPKKDGPNAEQMAAVFSRAVNYYDKKTGVSVKGLVYDKDGKVTTTTVTSDVTFDEAVADDQFVFKAPPGVEVVDMTQMQQEAQGQTEQAQATEAPAQDEKSEAKATESGKKEPAKTAKAEEPREKKKDDNAGKAVKGLLKGLGR